MKREWNKVILNEINENKADPCSVLNRHENNSVKVSGENSMMPWIKHLEQCLVYIPVLDSFSFSPLSSIYSEAPDNLLFPPCLTT